MTYPRWPKRSKLEPLLLDLGSKVDAETLPRPSWNCFVGVDAERITVSVYQPVWHAGFIWDDDRYVTNNPLLSAPDGLWRIWFSLDAPSQYFPLSYTLLRIGHFLWGLNPAGFHWLNIVLHICNVLFVWWLLDAAARARSVVGCGDIRASSCPG